MLPPLAERMRPQHLEEYIGQQHLVGEGAILRKMIESGSITSFILWGPPGVGKTTLARIIASKMNRGFYALSAVNSSVKDIREIIEKSKKKRNFLIHLVLFFLLTRFIVLVNHNRIRYWLP